MHLGNGTVEEGLVRGHGAWFEIRYQKLLLGGYCPGNCSNMKGKYCYAGNKNKFTQRSLGSLLASKRFGAMRMGEWKMYCE